jgi:hypothetical protein
MVITNDGTGPALKVTQTGANSIAEFYDDGNALAFKVANDGLIGIGTATPQAKLHVVGSALVSSNLNVTGNLVPTAVNLVGTGDTSTAATHYFVETASDGFIRPKPLANATAELVTTASVNSAAATIVGMITSGVWNAGAVTSSGNISSAAQFLGKSGDSVGAPSFSWTGNSNTGIYRPATNTFGVVTNGVERMRIDASGNVGIGTMSISARHKLYVNGITCLQGTDLLNTGDGSLARYTDMPQTETYINLYKTGNRINNTGPSITFGGSYYSTNDFGTVYAAIKGVSSGSDIHDARGSLKFYTNTNPTGTLAESDCKLIILNTGNVGIGTTNPLVPLDIKATSNGDVLTIRAPGGNQSGTNASIVFKANSDNHPLGAVTGIETASGGAFRGGLALSAGTSTSMVEGIRLASNGNVGIGTTNPQVKLQINGQTLANKSSAVLGWTGLEVYNGLLVNSGDTIGPEFMILNDSTGGKSWGFISTGAAHSSGAGNLVIRNRSDGIVANVTITSAGNVGIGTATPQAKLHCSDNIESDNRIIGKEGLLLINRYTIFHHRSDSGYEFLVNRNTFDSEIWYADATNKALYMQIPGFSGDTLYTLSPTVLNSGYYQAQLRSVIDNSRPIPPQNTTYSDVRLYAARTTVDKMVIKGNVGIGTTNPQSILHALGKVDIHQVGAGGGENRFNGLEAPSSANGRAQLVLSSAWSDLVIASSQASSEYGSTLTFAAYNPSNSADYRKFVIQQRGWGGSQFMDFGYTNAPTTNPHTVVGNGRLLTIDGNNQRVGIGIAAPQYPLDVARAITSPSMYGVYMNYNGSGTWTGTWGVSGKFQEYVWATVGFVASSDARIKTNIQDIDDNAALSQLRLLKPRTYEYIDKIQRGSESVIGFIAQEVGEIIPRAVSKGTEIIPSIYELAICTNNIIQLEKQHNLAVDDTVQLIQEDLGMFMCKVKTVLSSTSFSVEEQEVHDGNVFVFGKQIDDFNKLDKNAIFTIGVAATQELDREVQQLKSYVSTLEARILAIENKN